MPTSLLHFKSRALITKVPSGKLPRRWQTSEVAPLMGLGLAVALGVAIWTSPSHAPKPTPPPSVVAAPTPVPPLSGGSPGPSRPPASNSPWLEEVIPLGADVTAALTVRPEGEILLASLGGGLEVQIQHGDFAVSQVQDGFRVRPRSPDSRGEAAVWCDGQMFNLRLRTDEAAPARRRLWLAPPAPRAPAAEAGSDPQSLAQARQLLDELIELESHGPGGDGAGDWGRGEQDGLAFHWRRALRRGGVCGAVLDLTDQRNEPYFFEPSSLGVDLPGRGAPRVLARSGEGMLLPGRTQPAVVVWHDPLPPGGVSSSPADATNVPPAGPYTLKLRPWQLNWRELAAIPMPPGGNPSPGPGAVAAIQTQVPPAPTPRPAGSRRRAKPPIDVLGTKIKP